LLPVRSGGMRRLRSKTKVHRLHDQMQWAFAEIEKARQEARDSVAGLRQVVEQQADEHCGQPSRLTRQRTRRRSARPRR
jgi:hypothetical protein